MKKITNRSFTTLLATSLLLGGCSKSYLNKTPYDAITPGQALSTESALTSAVNGVYSNLRSVTLFGRDLTITGDLMGDNTYVEKKNSGRYLIQYNYTMAATDGIAQEIWSNAYTGIMRTNQIIDATVSTSGVPAIKAEAYALRALLYFKLITYYAKPYTDDPSSLGVPLVLHYNPNGLPSRAKVSEVYQQIVSDLKTAFQNGPAYVNSTRLSKYSIEALLAKVYLYMGDNTNAKAAAVDVINNSGFTLVPAANLRAYWSNASYSSNKQETLFEVDADAINNNAFDDYAGMYMNGYNDIYASSDLYNLYSATDVRKSLMKQGTTKNGSAAIIVTKFPNATNADRDNMKVLRLSGVYLIAAEASLPGNETDALMYLNTLMAQRDPAFPGYADTGAALLNDIITERRKELAFEGDRFTDLNRLKLPINRVSNPGAIPAPLTIPYPDNRRVFPIPQAELQANPNIAKQQNPGY